MNSAVLLRRVERLEEALSAREPRDDWVDVLMWVGENGGVFGHAHCLFSESRGGETRWVPCSEGEELSIMRRRYDEEGRRWCGKGVEVSFAEYLERFSYLGPEELANDRRMIVERVEKDGS